MPLAWAAEFYWPGDGVVNVAPATTTQYPAWQGTSVSACALILVTPDAWGWWLLPLALVMLPWPWRRPLTKAEQRRVDLWVRRYVPDWLWLAWRLRALLKSDLYREAVRAVRSVAVEPGMREPEMWGEIGHRVAKLDGVGENVFRHLLAFERMGPCPRKQRHARNVAIELAYLVLKER